MSNNSWYNRIWPKVASTPEPTTLKIVPPQGWQCLLCGRVWAPGVMECPGPHPTGTDLAYLDYTPKKIP